MPHLIEGFVYIKKYSFYFMAIIKWFVFSCVINNRRWMSLLSLGWIDFVKLDYC